MKNLGLLLSCATLSALASPLAAQTAAEPAAPAGGTPAAPAELDLETSQNATVNLVRLLVKQGVIPRDAAVDLIRQAEAEARQARAQAAAVTAAAEQIKQAAESELKANESDIRITYVPENVHQEIAADVRNEIAAQARTEGWGKTPQEDESAWTKRFKPFGDLRLRYNQVSYDGSEAIIPDFNAVNTGSPYDTSAASTNPFPSLNTDENRRQFQLRARLGLEADLSDGYTAGFRLATGNSASPVSTNQTVGSPGNFQRYSVWLDQAFLRWETRGDEAFSAKVTGGRFENPFFRTELTWDADLMLDGLALEGAWRVTDNLKAFGAVGIFPVFNTALNFPANQSDKFASDDRYLYAAQIGADYKVSKAVRLKSAVAVYYFPEIEGELSDPVLLLNSSDAGNTDGRRPGFAQKGNTYMPLRQIISDASNNFGTTNQWQYFGLASEFIPATFTAQLDLNHFEPFQISFYGEVVKNLGYDQGHVNSVAINNLNGSGTVYGGDLGWTLGVNVGQVALQKAGDWRAGLAYRYLESDAFVDGFVDSDFGLGGTNLQGYLLSTAYALSPRVYLALRWLSATEIDGPAFRNDVLQFDINSKF